MGNYLIFILSPEDTPFEDGTFRLVLRFDETYPNKPPSVKFISKMFHPNVYPDGQLCLDILQNRWSPTYDVSSILTSIQSLLHDPNPNSPANALAAQLYIDNRQDYIRRVKETVELSWFDDEDEQLLLKDSCQSPVVQGSEAETTYNNTQNVSLFPSNTDLDNQNS